MSMMVLHILCCLWVFMSKISAEEDGISGTWMDTDWKENSTDSELYLVSFYYIITTMTTVGYGDIYPSK